MPVQYFTLRALSSEFGRILHGAVLIEAFSQRRNELLLSLRLPSEADQEESTLTLFVSVESKNNFIFLRNRMARARKNSVDLFPAAIGSSVHRISIHPNDRIVSFELQPAMTMSFLLFNTSGSNILLTGRDNNILEAFKNNKQLSGREFKPPPESSTISTRTFASSLRELPENGKATIYSTIKKMYPFWGSLYIVEILHRSELRCDELLENLDDRALLRVQKESQAMFHELDQPHPSIYYTADKETVLSMTEQRHLAENTNISFTDVNDSVKNFVIGTFHQRTTLDAKNELGRKLQQELEQCYRTIKKIDNHLSGNHVQYEILGNSILANLHAIKKGMTHIEVPDLYRESASLLIALEPALTPAQNAERYFTKARKSRLAHEESAKRLKDLHQTAGLLQQLSADFDHCSTEAEIEDYKKRHREELLSMKLLQERPDEKLPPFRIFTVQGGFSVWVGKSSANNDLLTTKYAKPRDLWFHARGASGSHTVLKVKSDEKPIPKAAIYQAAGIAAYYSKMRNAGSVPVAYCERKYVRKRKGSQEGTVFLEREEVVFVKPALP